MGDLELLEEFTKKLDPSVQVDHILVNEDIDILSIEGQGLFDLPKEIGYFGNLRVLFLKDNNLGTLPPAIGHLHSLERLNLTSNRIITLPEEIGKCVNLKELLLDFNPIDSLPKSLANAKSLEVLRLNENNFNDIPDFVFSLPNLKELYIERNAISDIPDKFHGDMSLRLFHLNDNQITTIPPSIESLSNLEIIRLANNHLTAIPVELVKLLELIEADFSGNKDLMEFNKHYNGKLEILKLREYLKKIRKSEGDHTCTKCGYTQPLGIIICQQCQAELPHCFVCKQGFVDKKRKQCFSCDSLFHHEHLGSVYKITGKCPNCKEKM